MSKIYIASKGVVFENTPLEHLYLVKDIDGIIDGSPIAVTDEFIIRGGPESGIPFFNGKIMLESSLPIFQSDDNLDGNTVALDRNYTEIDLQGRDADEVWDEMVASAQSYGILQPDFRYHTDIDYSLTFNSNSTIHSVLSSVGIDLFLNMPIQDGLRKNIIDFPGITSVYGSKGNGEIDVSVLSRSDLTSDVYDQGGNTTIKIKTNNEYNIWVDMNFATQDVLQVQDYAGNAFSPLRSGDDLFLLNIDNPSDIIVTLKDFYGAPARRLNFVDKVDASGAVSGSFKIALDTSNHYGWDAVTYAFAPGNETALTHLNVKLDNGTETVKVFSGTGAGGLPANITKEDLTYLLQANFVIGNQMQTDYQYQQGTGALTSAQGTYYREQLIATATRAQQYFQTYMTLDNTGVNAYLASESFLQSIRAWTLNKQADLGSSTEERTTVGTLQAQLLTMYSSLTGAVSSLAATGSYAEQAALVQKLAGFTTNAGQVYQETLSQNLPNAAVLLAQYRGMFEQLKTAELTRLAKLDANAALSDIEKYVELFTVAPAAANELAFAAAKLGYTQTDVSLKVVAQVFPATIEYATSRKTLAENIVGLNTIVATGLSLSNWLAGTANVNVLTGTAAANVLSGYGGNDTLNGGDGFDLLFGGTENDLLNGDAANDTLFAGTGDDVLQGGAGTDILHGEDGNDTLNGGAGVDQLTGGLGIDVFKFSALTDSVHTTGQMDRIADFTTGVDKIDLTGLGFTGVTTATPNAGQLRVTFDAYYNHTYVRDLNGSGFGLYLSGNHITLSNSDFIGLVPVGQTLTGTAGNNTLSGSEGDNLILGLGGSDQLFGNGGSDTLNGGAGVDQLTGGLGADVFTFGVLTDSVHTTGQMDRIADFVIGTDKIDVTGLGFTGVTTGTPTAGQLKVSYDSYYNHTYVRDLTTGTGFGFYLTGNQVAMSNSDFIGLGSSFSGLSAASFGGNLNNQARDDFSAYPRGGIHHQLNDNTSHSKISRYAEIRNSAIDDRVHHLINAMASFAPIPINSSSSSNTIADLQRPQLYGELASGGN